MTDAKKPVCLWCADGACKFENARRLKYVPSVVRSGTPDIPVHTGVHVDAELEHRTTIPRDGTPLRLTEPTFVLLDEAAIRADERRKTLEECLALAKMGQEVDVAGVTDVWERGDAAIAADIRALIV